MEEGDEMLLSWLLETSDRDIDYSQLKELAQERTIWCRRKTKTCPLGSVTLDWVRSGPSNMYRCRAFLCVSWAFLLFSRGYARVKHVHIDGQARRVIRLVILRHGV